VLRMTQEDAMQSTLQHPKVLEMHGMTKYFPGGVALIEGRVRGTARKPSIKCRIAIHKF